MRDPDSIPEDHHHRYYIRENGYPTDRLLDGLDDRDLLLHMGVPPKYIQFAAAAAKAEMDPVIESWLGNLPSIFRPQFDAPDWRLCGMGLVFHGPSGTRKTTAAAALLLRLVRIGIPNADPSGKSRWYGAAMGRYVGWQDASALFREAAGGRDEGEGSALLRAMEPDGPVLARGDFLVLDDISRERVSEFNVGELTRILRHRSEGGYPTIVTTNHTPAEWPLVYGPVMGAFMARSLMTVAFKEEFTP